MGSSSTIRGISRSLGPLGERIGFLIPAGLAEAVYTCFCAGGHLLVVDDYTPNASDPAVTLLDLLNHLVGVSLACLTFSASTEPLDVFGPPASSTAFFRRGVVDVAFGHARGVALALDRSPIALCNLLVAKDLGLASMVTQNAVLRGMEEGRSCGLQLPSPFVVVSLSRSGHLPLIKPQLLDRFTVMVRLGERLPAMTTSVHPEPPLASSDIPAAKEAVHATFLSYDVARYLRDLITRIRDLSDRGYGCSPSPRASLSLLLTAKTLAHLSGSPFVTPDHAFKAAMMVLEHRFLAKIHPNLAASSRTELQHSLRSVAPPI